MKFRTYGYCLLLTLALPIGVSSRPYEAIQGESLLSYSLVHPMHKITGVSRGFLCQVELSPDTLSSVIKVSALISSFDSRNSSRDSHAMEMVEALKYPRVEFASDSVKGQAGQYQVSGKLTFHGRSRPVNFLVTSKSKGSKIEITGGFSVKLSDFDVARPTLLFIAAEDKLTISFDLFANQD